MLAPQVTLKYLLLDLLLYDFTLTQCCCSLVVDFIASKENFFRHQTELDRRDPPGLLKESCNEELVCFKYKIKCNNQFKSQ